MDTVKISAADVKKLRDITGAGMMDCKKALTEAEGDFDKAIEVLRKKGQKVSAKRADRDAKEGAVVVKINDARTKGVVLRLSCETDFVAKNADFVNMATSFAQAALENGASTKEDVLAIPYEGITIGEKVTEQNGVIGEKIEIADFAAIEAPMVAPYVHMGNRAGVLIALNKADDSFFEPGRDVAMQVAAMKPLAVNKDGVDATLVEKEIEIGKEQARAEGKPEAMLERIAMGKLNKFYKENTLLSQAFVKDSKQSVEQYLKSVDPDLTVTDFKHIMLG